MRVNIGGEPGRDDYGLPPVDVEIPDDARELERDVHAYHRELRSRRRRMLARRLSAPLTRDGMVLPLLAGCLALTLLAGTLLTVFTAGQRAVTEVPHPGNSAPRATAPASAPQPGLAGSSLPDATVIVNGQPSSLQALTPTGAALVLALVPAGCQCTRSVRQLVREARAAGVQPYLVGTNQPQLLALTKQAGLGRSHAVSDSEHTLPAGYHPSVLTALLVSASGRITDRIPAAQATTGRLKAAMKSLTAQVPRATRPAATQKAATATAGPKLSTPTS
jgi:hypothetical protein